MVSFSCEGCGDVMTKPKIVKHKQKCRGAPVTCLDCNKTFHGNEHVGHTSCISEAQKFHKTVYQGEKKKGKKEKKDNTAMEVDEPSAAIALPEVSLPSSTPAAEDSSLKRKLEEGNADGAEAKDKKKKRKKEKKQANGEVASAAIPADAMVPIPALPSPVPAVEKAEESAITAVTSTEDQPAATEAEKPKKEKSKKSKKNNEDEAQIKSTPAEVAPAVVEEAAATTPAIEEDKPTEIQAVKPKKEKKSKKSTGEEAPTTSDLPSVSAASVPPEAGPVKTVEDLASPDLSSRIKTVIRNKLVVNGVQKTLGDLLQTCISDPYVVGTEEEIREAFMGIKAIKGKVAINLMLGDLTASKAASK